MSRGVKAAVVLVGVVVLLIALAALRARQGIEAPKPAVVAVDAPPSPSAEFPKTQREPLRDGTASTLAAPAHVEQPAPRFGAPASVGSPAPAAPARVGGGATQVVGSAAGARVTEEVPVFAASADGIREAMAWARYDFGACYSEWQKVQPALEGRPKVTFSIVASESGQASVEDVSLVSGLSHPVLEGCVVSAVREMRFENPEGQERMNVTYPLSFNVDAQD